MRSLLRHDLTAAMKARDAVAVAALRSLLAAIDDAEAVDPAVVRLEPGTDGSQVAGATSGLGSGEVSRHTLTDDELAALLRTHLAELTSAVSEFEGLGRADLAARLRAEADVVGRYIAS